VRIKSLIKLSDCKKCQSCCKFKKDAFDWAPVFSSEEKEKIERLRGKKFSFKNYQGAKDLFQLELVRSKKKNNLYVCPFLNEDKQLCEIQKIKFLDCKIWPFVVMRSKDGKFVNLFCFNGKICPGIKNLSGQKLKKYGLYLKRKFQSPQGLKFIRRHLKFVWKYDPDTIFITKITKTI